MLLPISAIVPTRNRSQVLARTLESLAQQSVQPIEMIVVDASSDDLTEALLHNKIHNLKTQIKYYKATATGAATQRNQALNYATQKTIWLMDDDILLHPECLARLWEAVDKDITVGGVNAMITNQCYLPPGKFSRWLFSFLNGGPEKSYAGKCIGPAMNLLPADDPNLPEIVPVEWLNTTCTLYRKEALPTPMFSDIFVGYSLMEDVTLSLIVGKQWKLMNARTARIFHDSQPGDHKNNLEILAEMSLVNRHFVMSKILERNKLEDYFKFFVLQAFEVIASVRSPKGWSNILPVLGGKLKGVNKLIINRAKSKILST